MKTLLHEKSIFIWEWFLDLKHKFHTQLCTVHTVQRAKLEEEPELETYRIPEEAECPQW